MKLDDIPQFIDARCRYEVDVSWRYLQQFLDTIGAPVELCPEFQRGHVWTTEQQIAYIEYCLRGGRCSREVIFSSEGYGGFSVNPLYLIDGLQRITATQEFLKDRIPAFGHFLSEYSDARLISRHQFGFKVRVVDTDIVGAMQLYLDLNAGGTPHAAAEIERVRNLLKEATK